MSDGLSEIAESSSGGCSKSLFAVFDYTTNNLLGEYDTRAEAEEVIEKIKPLGRYGPDGHDLRILPLDAEGRVIADG